MKAICWKEKGLKRCTQNVTRCINCQQKCTQFVYRPIYICTIKQKTSLTVSPLDEPYHWGSDISSRKRHHIGKTQSMVWRKFYKYLCHVSTNFCTCNFSTLCMPLKLSVMLSTVDWHPPACQHPILCHSRRRILFSVVCSLTKYNSAVLL